MKASRQRLDVLLVERGLVRSRQRAAGLILAGEVWVDGTRMVKAGSLVDKEAAVRITGKDIPYVSRGGVKLRHALDNFEIDVWGEVAMDVGASTGGFTDCLLQAGAKLVYAIDVGYGQFDMKLRNDERVRLFERTNIRYLEPETIDPPPSFSVIDVSFISLQLVLPQVYKIMNGRGNVVALIKPQFEVGKGQVGKGGVVKDPDLHRQVIERIRSFAEGLGYLTSEAILSPIKGPKGNKEFLILLKSPKSVD